MSNIVQELREYLSNNPAFKAAFEEAFKTAKGMDIPQFDEYGISTFDDYINFYETLLTWTPSENLSGNKVYYHLCMFYFVIDLDPVKNYQAPIQPQSVPPWPWLSDWLVRYAIELGKFMDTPASITPESLATFYTAANYHMQDYPPQQWNTFNEFFARKINPASRPIDPGRTVIVSPADATFDGWWPIDSNAEVTIKQIPWSIGQLLEDSQYGKEFAGGIFMHSFLAPSDYHRQHAPVSGKVLEAKVIQGLCYLQVVAETDPDGKPKLGMRRGLEGAIGAASLRTSNAPNDAGSLVAPDDAGYQFLQARGLVVLENEEIGLVAVLPIGMAQVSSVELEVKIDDVLEKGDEISYFQFGGSDIVVVFQAKSNVEMTAVVGTHYNFGKQIAVAGVNATR